MHRFLQQINVKITTGYAGTDNEPVLVSMLHFLPTQLAVNAYTLLHSACRLVSSCTVLWMAVSVLCSRYVLPGALPKPLHRAHVFG